MAKKKVSFYAKTKSGRRSKVSFYARQPKASKPRRTSKKRR